MLCPACATPVSGRATYCSGRCRVRAHRARHDERIGTAEALLALRAEVVSTEHAEALAERARRLLRGS